MSDNTDYRAMWQELGLDLAKHDLLLDVLGKTYADLFLTQPDRPRGMDYFNFVMSEIHGLRVKELVAAREAGRKVVGSFCVFVPEELILALDAVSVGLCAGAEFGFDKAEQYLPRSTCSLIKSFFGFALEKVCPYISASDVVVGENTCDGKKKSYEIFKEMVSRLYVMDLPQTKSEEGKALLRAEFARFADYLQELTGKTLTVEGLRRAIGIVNAKRNAMKRLAKVRASNPAPISGLDALLANQVFFYDDPVRFTGAVNGLCDELEQRAASGVGLLPSNRPRLLISGCPMAIPNWKLPWLVETTGAVIVGEESCVGERGTQFLTDDSGATLPELMNALVDRYFKINCAIFTPNPERLDHIRQMAADYKVDGVIHYGLQFCGPYQMEARPVELALEAAGIPTLRIDTDYSMEDVEQLRTRIEAFVERLKR